MSKSRAPRSTASRVLFVLVVVVTSGGILGVIVLSFGRVTGSEFAPDQFARREFVYYRVPLIRLQITPVVRWNDPHELEKRLTKKNAILTKKPVPGRWDVVSMWAGSNKQGGDAEILCNYLDMRDKNGDFKWLTWTNDDVARATPFWKAVHRASDLQAYDLIPGLFELAGRHDGSQELAKAIDDYMARECESLADDYSSLADSELAAKFYATALNYDQENATLKRKHEKTQQKLNREATPGEPLSSSHRT